MSHPHDLDGRPRILPGPADRQSFFDEQERNRRKTWIMAVFCVLAVLIMGAAASVIITPLIAVAYGAVLRIVSWAVRVPDFLHWPLRMWIAAIEPALNTLDTGRPIPRGMWVPVVSALIGPGMLGILVLWLPTRALLRRTAVEAALEAVGAREPRPQDLEEMQVR